MTSNTNDRGVRKVAEEKVGALNEIHEKADHKDELTEQEREKLEGRLIHNNEPFRLLASAKYNAQLATRKLEEGQTRTVDEGVMSLDETLNKIAENELGNVRAELQGADA
jgi:hypothetical protein